MSDSKKNSSRSPLFTLLLVGFSAFVLGALVMYAVSLMLMGGKDEMVVENTKEIEMSGGSSFFDVENAYVLATIVDFSDSSITLSSTKKQTETFELAKDVFVSKPGQPKTATASGQKSALEKDKQATVNLVKRNGKFQVVSVMYAANPLILQ